jgi:hypothetical protein
LQRSYTTAARQCEYKQTMHWLISSLEPCSSSL